MKPIGQWQWQFKAFWLYGAVEPPPHCPELNPVERLWLYLKRDLYWSLFNDSMQLQTKIDQLFPELPPEIVVSVTGFPFILEALSVANIT